jgi:hypothetical protein
VCNRCPATDRGGCDRRDCHVVDESPFASRRPARPMLSASPTAAGMSTHKQPIERPVNVDPMASREDVSSSDQ